MHPQPPPALLQVQHDCRVNTTTATPDHSGLLPSFTIGQSVATGVSADGNVVVGYATPYQGCCIRTEAFRWTRTGGMVGLGFLPGGSYSGANAVNADGAVVVGYSSDKNGNSTAIKWTAGTGMQSIKDILIANGVNMAGWTLTEATGVSADGTVISGNAETPSNNNGEAWVATIPVNAFALLDLTPSSISISLATSQILSLSSPS